MDRSWAVNVVEFILRVLTRLGSTTMTAPADATPVATWVAIDIAKRNHAVLIETPDGR